MKRRSMWIVVAILLLSFVGASTASAADEIADGEKIGAAEKYVNGLLGEYYDSAAIGNESALKMRRIDRNIGWNFGYDSPEPTLPAEYRITNENYSIRWKGYLKPEKDGIYVLKTLSDDGVRLRIDHPDLNGEYAIDSWGLLSLDYTSSKEIKMEAGQMYYFELEYQQGPLYGAVYLLWERDKIPQGLIPESAFFVGVETYKTYLKPQYFNAVKYGGNGFLNSFSDENGAKFSENSNIDYNWGLDGPEKFETDRFRGTMRGYLIPRYTETLTLVFIVDDAIIVTIGGETTIKSWDWNSQERFMCKVDAVAGEPIEIQVEYADFGLAASVQMGWTSEALGVESGVIPVEYMFYK